MNYDQDGNKAEARGYGRKVKGLCKHIFPQLFVPNRRCEVSQTANDPAPLIVMYASEAQAICRHAVVWDGIEAGGHLHGGFTGAGDPVVLLATPPGPNARHSKYGFTQDFAYFNTSDRFLMENHGASTVGRHHSHHDQKLYDPSQVDNTTSSSIMINNHSWRAFAEVIATTNKGDSTVRLDAYLIRRGSNGSLTQHPAQLVILPGTSPLRVFTFGSIVFPTADMYAYSFPPERMVIAQPLGEISENIPKEITQEVSELPIAAQQDLKAVRENGIISIELGLGQIGRVYVGYAADSPGQPVGVLLRRAEGKGVTDLTHIIIPAQGIFRLSEIYCRVVDYVAKMGDPVAPSDHPPFTSLKDSGEAWQSPPPSKSSRAQTAGVRAKVASGGPAPEKRKDWPKRKHMIVAGETHDTAKEMNYGNKH
jgi:hypothetical protein